jgi:D-amino peptidase
MKVHMTVDMEGIAGMAHEDQADRKDLDYQRMRDIMTGEVQAAVEGARAGGAEEFVICDAHDTGLNLLVEKLDEDVEVIEGASFELGMMAGMSEDFDAAFQVGYHSMRDTHAGTIGHTYTYSVSKLRLNGVLVGESGLNAAIAGHFGVPVVMVSGDLHAVKQAQALIDGVVGVPTKEGLGTYGTRTLMPARARRLIREGAEAAMSKVGSVKPYVVDRPVGMQLTFTRSIMAQYASGMPSVERVDDKTVSYEADDTLDAYRVFEVMLMVARAAGKEGEL